MKRIFFAFATALLLMACSDNTFRIEGKIANADKQVIFLEHMGIASTQLIDSTHIKKNGSFHFKQLRPDYPDLYRIRLGNDYIIFAIDSTETININADANNFATGFTVQNSNGTERIRQLRQSSLELQQLAQKGSEQKINAGIAKHRELAKSIIMENPRSMAAYYAIYQSINGYYFLSPNSKDDLILWSTVATQYQTYYPDYIRSKKLKETTLAAIRAKRAEQHLQANDIVLEETGVIDINLPNRAGDLTALSSLKGNVVLLDFSAYAMDESAAHTLFLRELFDKYHQQGFQIYQVSVDPNKLLWLEKSQNIPWVTVRDNNGLESRYLQTYNITDFPSFFIINRKGDILGRYNYNQLNNIIVENL